MDILWTEKRERDTQLTSLDEETGKEKHSEDTEEQTQEQEKAKEQVEAKEVVQVQAETKTHVTKVNRLAFIYSMLNAELLNEMLMYVVSMGNVLVGIATSLYFIYILTLRVSPVFLVFLPFVIFRWMP
jgi:hypothetical protein